MNDIEKVILVTYVIMCLIVCLMTFIDLIKNGWDTLNFCFFMLCANNVLFALTKERDKNE